MKKMFFILSMMIMTSSLVIAGETPVVAEKYETAFKRNFPGIATTEWQKSNNMVVAEFRENETRHLAYFDKEANLVAVIRYINTDYMSLRAKDALRKKYGSFEKMNVLEVSLTDGDNFYLLTVMHNDAFKKIKVYQDGGIEIVKG